MVWKKKLHVRQSIIFSRQLATTITLRYDKTLRIVLLTRYKNMIHRKQLLFSSQSYVFLLAVLFSSRSYISPLGRTFLLSVVLSRSFFLSAVLPYREKKYDFHRQQKRTTSIKSKKVRLTYRALMYGYTESKKVRVPYRARKSTTSTEQKLGLPYTAKK